MGQSFVFWAYTPPGGYVIYLKRFFHDLPFYHPLNDGKKHEDNELWRFLISPWNVVVQSEINKWLEIAYSLHVEKYYKDRLNYRKTDIYKLKSVLYELMVAFFLQDNLGMKIVQHNPPADSGRFGEWIFRKNNDSLFVEVKTPWEIKKAGSRWYSHAKKLEETLHKAYRQKPASKMPFVIFITDELDMSLIFYDHELIDVLYGKMGIVFDYKNGKLTNERYEVTDKRSMFQYNIRSKLSGVAILGLYVVSDGKDHKEKPSYQFRLYHNPYCDPKCRIKSILFDTWPQLLPDYDQKKMKWINYDKT